MIALGPVIDGDFFPKPLNELRKEAPSKRFINGTTEYEGLLFCKFYMKLFLNYVKISNGFIILRQIILTDLYVTC
jgi:hypothetical protein